MCNDSDFSLVLSPALKMRSVATDNCVFGVSAVRTQPEEKPAPLVNIRATAAPTSAVLFIKVDDQSGHPV